jgi:hypothetical protein
MQGCYRLSMLAMLLGCCLCLGCPQKLVNSSDSSKLEHSGEESGAGSSSADQSAADVGQQSMTASEIHKPGIVIGNAMQWSVLDKFDGSYEDYASLLAGNFDTDPEWELLHVTQYTCSILELDGTLRELPILGWVAGTMELAWDWDGDGVMEIVTRGYGPEQPVDDNGYSGLQILGLQGEVVAELPGSIPIASSLNADLDGDGFAELLMEDRSRDGIVAYGIAGVELWFTTVLAGNIILAAADFDGDGKSELLGRSLADRSAEDTGLLRAWSMGQPGVAIPGLRDADPLEHPYFATDLNGDGRAEIVTSTVIVNPADGSRTALQMPVGWSVMDFGPFPAQLVAYHSGGQSLLAARVLEQHGSERSDTLVMWDAGGRIVYQEHFVDALDAVLAVPTGDGSDRLVILRADGVYVEAE